MARNVARSPRVAHSTMQQSTFDIPESEVAQIRAEIRAQINEMKRINEQMRKDDDEIERSINRTRANLAKIAQMVAL